ncbi:APC family permease [Ureaplasma ceti]|uniref:Amino acid permease n=1 Tax=Ureaplasma ceti TaxID=3119530 RepID=A0ABP9U986_9BACT
MSSVSMKTAKKIGLFAAISVLIGSIIGIGIFFKNGTVFANNDNNGIGVLISWILASVIALTTAFSFAEIGFNHRDGAGLAGCVGRMYGHKFERFISFNNSFFYFAILNLSIAIFSAEAIVNIFDNSGSIKMHMGWVMLIALALIVIFVLFNYLSLKWSNRFQMATTILKFIPLIMVAVAGIAYGAMHPTASLFTNGKAGPLSVNGILSSIPAILFAYDSFLGVASLQGEMENPKKKVPLTIILGMGICIAFYLLVTVGQIMVSQGSAYAVFEKVLEHNQKAAYALRVIISVFILICVLGVLNSLVLVGLRTYQYSIQYRIFYGYWWFNRFSNKNMKAGMLIALLIYGFWWTVFLIPSAILNTDAFVDGFSNFPTLFMFAIYGTVILKGWINRFSKKVHVTKMPGFIWIAPIAVLGCYLAFGYQFFYFFSIKAFIDPMAIVNWGLFSQGGFVTRAYMSAICFFVMIAVFVLTPFINDAFLKLKYNKIDQHKILSKELLV